MPNGIHRRALGLGRVAALGVVAVLGVVIVALVGYLAVGRDAGNHSARPAQSSPHVAETPAAVATTSARPVVASHPRAAEPTAGSRAANRDHPSRGQHAVDEVIAVLDTATPDWARATALLSRMPAAEQWQALSAPGVVDQPVANALRQSIVLACTGAMTKMDAIGISPEELATNAAAAWCHSLREHASTQYYFDEANRISASGSDLGDHTYIPTPPPDELSDEEAKAMSDVLIKRLRSAQNPIEISQAVLALWDLHSPLLAPFWPRIDQYVGLPKGRLREALAALTACTATHSCGPLSVTTMEYCTSMPGPPCRAGADLDTVLRTSLSMPEYRLVRAMLAHVLAARR